MCTQASFDGGVYPLGYKSSQSRHQIQFSQPKPSRKIGIRAGHGLEPTRVFASQHVLLLILICGFIQSDKSTFNKRGQLLLLWEFYDEQWNYVENIAKIMEMIAQQ